MIIIHDDGEIERSDEKETLTSSECVRRLETGDCCMMLGLQHAGYEIEKHIDPSGVLFLRMVPPLKRSRS